MLHLIDRGRLGGVVRVGRKNARFILAGADVNKDAVPLAGDFSLRGAANRPGIADPRG
jgi:hypothetical protein